MWKLGTKLTLFLSLIIVIVLSGYGYLSILSRRDTLIRKMKLEAKGIGSTLRVSLEKTPFAREMSYIQHLIDAVEEHERTLGVIVYHQGTDLVFRSRYLQDGLEPDLTSIKNSMKEDRPREAFISYKGIPVFTYTFSIKDTEGDNIGGATIFQNATFVEKDIRQAESSVLITTLLLIGVTVALVLFTTRRWVTHPLSQLSYGIENIAKGNFNARIHLRKGNEEISRVARAFNQMAVDLEKARDRIIEEAETKLTLERSLLQSEKLAIVGKLASELAHEIRTPLTSIKIFIQSLEKEIEMDNLREQDFRIIKKEIDRINENITRLLNFAKPEDPQWQSVNVHELLKDTLNLLMTKIKNNKIHLDFSLSDPLPALEGDPKQLGQVFLNLLLNAIEAMPQGGRLTIQSNTEKDPDGHAKLFQITVRDTGQGIFEDDMPHLFDPFFTTKEGGTGLGLSIVSSLVQKHHGTVEVESERGRGSSFILTLPIRKEASWEE